MASEQIRWDLLTRDEAVDGFRRVAESARRTSDALREVREAAQRASDEEDC